MDRTHLPENGHAAPLTRGRLVHKRAAPLASTQLDELLLDLLARTERPLSAYDLAAALHGMGHGTAAMSVYRALDRLVARRLVQKVETLSAYRLREAPATILMICVGCGRTGSVAVPDEHAALILSVRERGFDPANMVIEAIGRCGDCQAADLPGEARA